MEMHKWAGWHSAPNLHVKPCWTQQLVSHVVMVLCWRVNSLFLRGPHQVLKWSQLEEVSLTALLAEIHYRGMTKVWGLGLCMHGKAMGRQHWASFWWDHFLVIYLSGAGCNQDSGSLWPLGHWEHGSILYLHCFFSITQATPHTFPGNSMTSNTFLRGVYD